MSSSEIPGALSSQQPSRMNPDDASLVEQLIDPVVIFNNQGKPCFANPAARKLLTGGLTARLTAHLHADSSRRAVMKVRFRLDDGESIVLKIARKRIEWQGQRALLVSLHDVTRYITAIEQGRSSSEEKSQRLLDECERLRLRLHESEQAARDLQEEIASLQTRIESQAVEIEDLKETQSEQLASDVEASDSDDAMPMPTEENIIAAAMRKAWAVRGQSVNTDAWGVPVPEEPKQPAGG